MRILREIPAIRLQVIDNLAGSLGFLWLHREIRPAKGPNFASVSCSGSGGLRFRQCPIARGVAAHKFGSFLRTNEHIRRLRMTGYELQFGRGTTDRGS